MIVWGECRAKGSVLFVGGGINWHSDLESKYLVTGTVGIPCDLEVSVLGMYPKRCPRKFLRNNCCSIVCLTKCQKQPKCLLIGE